MRGTRSDVGKINLKKEAGVGVLCTVNDGSLCGWQNFKVAPVSPAFV